ncbi:MAG TPA: sigma-70 family RNA polymerase sigma factor [Cyclobacteriaceae bacterium]|nr:sigma-70 family RNA polymerase sigma factor [Cyclobacteriaceae bacterium]
MMALMADAASALTTPGSWTISKDEMNTTVGNHREIHEKSFLKAIEDHKGIIFKICRLYCNQRSAEEDLFQEIVYQLWKAFPSYRNQSAVSTWMYSVAIHTAIKTFKGNRIKLELTEKLPDLPAEEQASVGDEDAFLRFFHGLNKIDRAIVALMLENYSRPEIATITGISEKAVTMRLGRLKR